MMLVSSERNSLAVKRARSLQNRHFLATLKQPELFHLHSFHALRLLRDALVVLLNSDLQQGRIEVAEFFSLGLLVDAKPILFGLVLSLLRSKSANANTGVGHMRVFVVPAGFLHWWVADVSIDELLPILV